MQMLTTATKLDWNGWLRGIIGAFISGGAGAIGSGVAGNILDKQHDMNIIALMGWTFLVSGVFSLAKFLQVTPTPDVIKP
jgi:hypothetical protein